MRLRLVVTGIAVALVGGGLVASIFIASDAPPPSVNSQAAWAMVRAGTSDNLSYSLTATSSGSLTLGWGASVPASVVLWRGVPCATAKGTCVGSTPLAIWPFNSTGRWWTAGTIGSVYVVSVADGAFANLEFNDTLRESFTGSSHPLAAPMWLLTLTGGGILLAIGGVAVFLGLFLPSGVYSRVPDDPPALGAWEEDPREPPVTFGTPSTVIRSRDGAW